jgi:hypothetical protein
VKILNFTLTLEYLESAFYASAKKHAGLTGEYRRFAWRVREHEAAHIRSQEVFRAAIAIHPVQARHAARIRSIAGEAPAPASFNPALTRQQVLGAVQATGFLV